jgi:hypothetical protein
MDLRVRSQVTKGNNSSVLELSTRKQSAADVCGGAIGKEGFERELNYSLHFSPPQLNQGVSRQPSCMRAAFLRSRRAPSSFLCASVCVGRSFYCFSTLRRRSCGWQISRGEINELVRQGARSWCSWARVRERAAHGGAKASCLQIIMQEILLHATSGKLTGRCSGTFTLNFNLGSAFGLEL